MKQWRHEGKKMLKVQKLQQPQLNHESVLAELFNEKTF